MLKWKIGDVTITQFVEMTLPPGYDTACKRKLIPFKISVLNYHNYLLAFLLFWPTCALGSGWNDFERDIGHGFYISKTDAFSVCLGFDGYLVVCGDRSKGDYGPMSGFFFTENHLLIRTHGAKPSKHAATKFESDIEKEHFFIVDKEIVDPYRNHRVGPLNYDQFVARPEVPAKIRWNYPTRFGSNQAEDKEPSLFISFVATILAYLLFFGPIIIGLILFGVAWIVLKKKIIRTRNNR